MSSSHSHLLEAADALKLNTTLTATVTRACPSGMQKVGQVWCLPQAGPRVSAPGGGGDGHWG